MLKRWLAHPLTRGLDIDSAETNELRQRIVRDKVFLRRIYEEWYEAIIASLPAGAGEVLELGSGGGFLEEFLPGLITSDILPLPKVQRVVDAHALPFGPSHLRAIVMTNVLHHIPQVEKFFAEAARCVRPGGALVLIEPWVTPWSRLIYRRLHHEPFEPRATEWTFPQKGPLSGANGALPWIVFQRDRALFEKRFPTWKVAAIEPIMPFRYLVSGGVSLRSLMPGWSFAGWGLLEKCLSPWRKWLAMFARIVVERTTAEQVGTERIAA
jgi:SAM-dependent methyltransferase